MAISAAKRKHAKLTGRRAGGRRRRQRSRPYGYNAVKHGASAKTPVLPWENPAAFDELVVGYKNWIQPVGEIEISLVDQAALAAGSEQGHAFRKFPDDVQHPYRDGSTSSERLRKPPRRQASEFFLEQHGPLPCIRDRIPPLTGRGCLVKVSQYTPTIRAGWSCPLRRIFRV